MKFFVMIVCLSFFIFGCTAVPKKKEVVIDFPKAPPVKNSGPSAIDYLALQRSLLMERERDDLGFAEKSFNTCEAGFGYSSSQNCQKQNFVVIYFRLLCRDSEGTISTILTEQDTRPLDRRSVRWSLKGAQGSVQTDGDGYGKIITTASVSQRTQRIRLGVGSEFLYMRANEIQKIITPQPWCEQY